MITAASEPTGKGLKYQDNPNAPNPTSSFEKVTNFTWKVFPVVDTFICMSQNKGNPTQKATAGLNRVKDWVVFFAAINLLNKLCNKTLEKSQSARDFYTKHPVLTQIGLTATGLYAGNIAISLANSGLFKLKSILEDKPSAQKLIVRSRDKINNSRTAIFINKNILKPVERSLNKPTGKMAIHALYAGMWILFFKQFYDLSKSQKPVNINVSQN